jgi:hypothetical protein
MLACSTREVLSVPVYPVLTNPQIDHVAESTAALRREAIAAPLSGAESAVRILSHMLEMGRLIGRPFLMRANSLTALHALKPSPYAYVFDLKRFVDSNALGVE